MSQTFELPDFWVLFDPEGYADGSTHATFQGEIRHATAEDAWKQLTPLKRNREREQRQGWRVVGVEQSEWRDYWDRKRKLGDPANA